MISYQEFLPAPALREYIKCYWILDSNNQPVVTDDIILPCGCIDIVLQKESVLHAVISNGPQIILPRFIIGPQSSAGFTLRINGKVKIFGIRLFPHTTKSVFGFPLAELRNSIWSVQQVFNPHYTNLAEEVVQATCVLKAVELADLFFIKMIPLFLPLDYMVRHVCNTILTAKGDIRLQDIFQQYRETEQTLRLRFLKQVGIGPKEFISISRFQHATSLLTQDKVFIKSLTDIALSAGYYDQAHFIREFKVITGITPGQYFKQAHPISDFFTSPHAISFPLNQPK